MTKIDILNPKLIFPDNYQQFWVLDIIGETVLSTF